MDKNIHKCCTRFARDRGRLDQSNLQLNLQSNLVSFTRCVVNRVLVLVLVLVTRCVVNLVLVLVTRCVVTLVLVTRCVVRIRLGKPLATSWKSNLVLSF